MINPLRSEAEAFRFLIGTIVYFAAITIAAKYASDASTNRNASASLRSGLITARR